MQSSSYSITSHDLINSQRYAIRELDWTLQTNLLNNQIFHLQQLITPQYQPQQQQRTNPSILTNNNESYRNSKIESIDWIMYVYKQCTIEDE